VHDVQNLGNHLKVERTITLKKSDAMSTQRENLFHDRAIHRAAQPNHSDESSHPTRPEQQLVPEAALPPVRLLAEASWR
jgi:hypothetical protein